MRSLYLHPNGRWQAIDVEKDLWGALIVVTRSGGRNRRGVQLRGYPAPSGDALMRRLRALEQRRQRHGYHLAPDCVVKTLDDCH